MIADLSRPWNLSIVQISSPLLLHSRRAMFSFSNRSYVGEHKEKLEHWKMLSTRGFENIEKATNLGSKWRDHSN